MRLTTEAIGQINNKKTRTKLALKVDRSDQRIIYLLRHNPENSILTTAAALSVIEEETGLTHSEIIDESEVLSGKITA